VAEPAACEICGGKPAREATRDGIAMLLCGECRAATVLLGGDPRLRDTIKK
jgi:hypothetical protein